MESINILNEKSLCFNLINILL